MLNNLISIPFFPLLFDSSLWCGISGNGSIWHESFSVGILLVFYFSPYCKFSDITYIVKFADIIVL